MSDLKGDTGEVHMTIQITRKETGKVEEYELVGKCTAEEAEQLGIATSQEQSNGSDPQHSGS